MEWMHLWSWWLGGACLMNAVPHLVSGVCGRPFQTPFARPPGQGLSSSLVNAVWGCFNLAVAYGLLLHVGGFDLRNTAHAAALGLGLLTSALFSAWHFGRFHGGAEGHDR